MILRLALCFFSFILVSCISGPTKITQEVGGDKRKPFVLVDTRGSLEYTSYHVSGSINLNSQDFLLLKDPKQRSRTLDPDLVQIVERLARRGVSPLVKVTLIGSAQDSVENKKWQWLLKRLNVVDIQSISLDDYIKTNTPLRPQPDPDSLPVWSNFESKSILSAADQCFVSWSEEKCK